MKVQKNECKGKFFELVTEDFSLINDPSKLFENNQNRYPYRETDVLYLSESYCVWSLKAYDKILKKVKDNTMTFVLISGEENAQSITSEQFQKIVSEAKFGNCIDDIGNIVSFFDVLGKDLVFWLMYPQEQAAGFQIFLDQNSTASTITTESDGTKYTTIVYLRAQEHGTNSTLTATDFDVKFHEEAVSVDESSGLKAWQLGVIIGGSVLVVIILIVILCKCCCRRRY
ncbi:uncharacterized protein LOC123551502 [Mercenaria mercenaria]|uniref:uncharacterized protein LOC123551502 n=1 Tax=Mercenaria mercenaria TaxID=6596 RepID=UPI00234EBDDD|nr:uncharacterized protein LOC123551502 [Mercenaria mercenaria]